MLACAACLALAARAGTVAMEVHVATAHAADNFQTQNSTASAKTWRVNG